MKTLFLAFSMIILSSVNGIAQCSCYTVQDLSIPEPASMELVISNACDQNAYLNLYVISSIEPFDTLGRQELWNAAILPFDTEVTEILSTELSETPEFGTYRVSITNGTLNCDSVQFSSSLSTYDLRQNKMLSFQPNPFSDQAVLMLDHRLNNGVLTIYNMQGQVVQYTERLAGQSIAVHREDLATGTFLFSLTENDQQIANGKIIVKE